MSNRPLLPEEIEAILKDAKTPDNFIFTGWMKMNDKWIELGHTPDCGITVTPDSKPSDAVVTPRQVADKLNELESTQLTEELLDRSDRRLAYSYTTIEGVVDDKFTIKRLNEAGDKFIRYPVRLSELKDMLARIEIKEADGLHINY